MNKTISLLGSQPDFDALWRDALTSAGLLSRCDRFDDLEKVSQSATAVVVNALSEALDEDELLAIVGYVRACGLPIAVHFPPESGLDGIDDIVEDLCGGLVAHHSHEVARVVAALGRRLDHNKSRRFEYVTLCPNQKDVLAIFADGFAAVLSRPLSPLDAGDRRITAIELVHDAHTAHIDFDTGASLELSAATLRPQATIGSPPPTTSASPLERTELGARLRHLRIEAGLTQAELSRRTGIHRPNIARVEAGRHTPSLDTLGRIASAIGVPTTRVLA